jgi:DNA-binding MarR family transcriptional regulator
LARVTIDRAAELVQFAYPQVFYACHTRHGRARSGPTRLSDRDAQLLVHLDRRAPLTLSRLAHHMDLSASTLSEAVKRLDGLGYLAKARAGEGDRRRVGIALTPKGVAAVRASSVLETPRLRAVLGRLSAADRRRVVDGLDCLARACRPSIEEKRRWERRQHA